ncbi:MAG: hypothetical protein WCO75_05860, partial [Planctomycetota bacterium]
GLLFAMTEGLHLVLSQLVECERTRASGDVAMLMMIVGDRGDLMEQLRADIAESTSNGARPGLQYTLALFERAMWLVGKVAPAAPAGADCMPIDMIDPPPADAASDSLQHA